MKTAAELHDEIKRADTNTGVAAAAGVLLVDGDETLRRLILSWPNVRVRDPNPNEQLPDGLPEVEHLRWLWTRLEPDAVATWIRLSGLPDAPHVRRACWVAIEQRLVHPDGHLARFLEQWVRTTLGGMLASKMPKPTREERDAAAERQRARRQEGAANGRATTADQADD